MIVVYGRDKIQYVVAWLHFIDVLDISTLVLNYDTTSVFLH